MTKNFEDIILNNDDLYRSMIAGLSDFLNIISKVTSHRLRNAGNVLLGYWISKLTRRPVIYGLPVSVSVEPTTSCNLRCPECPSGLRSFTRNTGMLDEKLFKSVIDDVHQKIFYLLFYFQGEPYLHTGFLDMVRYAASKKIYTATSTNGHFIDNEMARKTVESGLDRLIISIDGTTQEVYEQYRKGGKLDKVLSAARDVIDWKKKLRSKTPQVIFQFLVVRPNEHQVDQAKLLAKETGVNKIVFKTAQIYDFENGNDLIPVNDKFSRYRLTDSNTYRIKNKLDNHCWRLWHSTVITWDGKMLPCCFDKDALHAAGSVTNGFVKEWRGKNYMDFRRSVLVSRKENDICTNCTEGLKVFS